VEGVWKRGIEAKSLCLKKFPNEEVRKGIVLFMNSRSDLKTKSIACQ